MRIAQGLTLNSLHLCKIEFASIIKLSAGLFKSITKVISDANLNSNVVLPVPNKSTINSNFEAAVLEIQPKWGKLLMAFVISLSKLLETASSGKKLWWAHSCSLADNQRQLVMRFPKIAKQHESCSTDLPNLDTHFLNRHLILFYLVFAFFTHVCHITSNNGLHENFFFDNYADKVCNFRIFLLRKYFRYSHQLGRGAFNRVSSNNANIINILKVLLRVARRTWAK